MIPLCLVTGFLGSGKTSLLKQIARNGGGRKLVFLVNEFSPQDIDGALVSRESDSVITVPGGSIFCKCLVTQFIDVLDSLPKKYPDVEGVVIEASGMADPRVIQVMLYETGLSAIYDLARIVSVVDPNSFLKLRHTLPNIIAQVEAADMVLINKVDCCSRELVDQARQAVTDVNGNAEIAECTHGECEFDLFRGRPDQQLVGEYAKCKDPNYSTSTVPVEVTDLAELEAFLSEGNNVYRAKGSVTIGGQKKGIEYSSSGLVLEPALNDAPGLVMITKGA